MDNSTITIEEFTTRIGDFVNFWTPCTCIRCGERTSNEVCLDCVAALAEADETDAFADDSIPAPCEVVERVAAELEATLLLGASDVRELNALGRTIRNLTGTLADETLVLGRLQRFTISRQLRAARTRLAELWRNIEFEFMLDREDVFAS